MNARCKIGLHQWVHTETFKPVRKKIRACKFCQKQQESYSFDKRYGDTTWKDKIWIV